MWTEYNHPFFANYYTRPVRRSARGYPCQPQPQVRRQAPVSPQATLPRHERLRGLLWRTRQRAAIMIQVWWRGVLETRNKRRVTAMETVAKIRQDAQSLAPTLAPNVAAELLTQHLLRLDGVDTHGDMEIRKARKEAVDCINKLIEKRLAAKMEVDEPSNSESKPEDTGDDVEHADDVDAMDVEEAVQHEAAEEETDTAPAAADSATATPLTRADESTMDVDDDTKEDTASDGAADEPQQHTGADDAVDTAPVSTENAEAPRDEDVVMKSEASNANTNDNDNDNDDDDDDEWEDEVDYVDEEEDVAPAAPPKQQQPQPQPQPKTAPTTTTTTTSTKSSQRAPAESTRPSDAECQCPRHQYARRQMQQQQQQRLDAERRARAAAAAPTYRNPWGMPVHYEAPPSRCAPFFGGPHMHEPRFVRSGDYHPRGRNPFFFF